MAAGLEGTAASSADNEELAVLVKQAVAEAIKEAIPTLVEDVVSQLTDKTQALVDAQVAVFRGEVVAMQAEISKDRILKAARGAAVEMEGRPIRFTQDYRRRLAFSEAMDALQKLNFRTFLLYPAKLKVMRGGVSHFFNTPREHRRILWAGLTAAKKMLALRWQPPHSLAWQQWANSFLEIVLMEWSVARMHGASHKTLQGWEAAHK
ncbi:hypothetical protein D9C73_027939 [Collichthys lucidus]|uniref:Uncharacterized protein n=1 Tax=Collichthys lucidus TaxID=240159 RepID=A0A4U5TUY7_COLLU|nr:hypothetical protein D9C73_027939 [Collichthys lucidus]